jgi:hypothetical protein
MHVGSPVPPARPEEPGRLSGAEHPDSTARRASAAGGAAAPTPAASGKSARPDRVRLSPEALALLRKLEAREPADPHAAGRREAVDPHPAIGEGGSSASRGRSSVRPPAPAADPPGRVDLFA